MTTKSLRTALFIALLAASFTATSQNYQLVWADEFTNGISDAWTFEIGTGNNGWGNNELQFYLAENAQVVDGMLEITAKAENFGGMNYTSTRMKTQCGKSFKYGRVEARIKMPSFTGSWPAFWMLGDYFSRVGWPRCGEIDIMEHVNTDPEVHGTMHWFNNGHVYFGGSTPIDVTEFHVYSVEWDETGIRWFVDGNLYHVANTTNGINDTNEFHHSYFLILNMAIGGNWPGFTVDESALPATMYVDYVRVYQEDGILDPTPALNLPCVAD